MRDRFKNILWIAAALVLIAGYAFYRTYQSEPPTQSTAAPEVRIEAAEADQHIGTPAEVCGEVSTAEYLTQVEGEPTFLNLGGTYPDQEFTAVIWGDSRGRWPTPPERLYQNREICVTGTIEMHEGTPQIIVESPGQIEIQ